MSQVIALYEVFRRRELAGQKTVALFIDLKKAYDVVPQAALMKKLEAMGVCGKTLTFFKELYKGTLFRVRAGEFLGEEREYQRGVRQGCPASTLLFDIFINDILDKVRKYGVEVPGSTEKLGGLLFADDLVLTCESAKRLRKALRGVERWADKWAMKIGTDKCGVLSLSDQCSGLSDLEWEAQGGQIPIVESYTYLGVEVQKRFDMNAVVTKRVAIMERALNAVTPFLVNKTIPISFKVTVLKAMVISVGLYGAELFGTETNLVSKLQTVINRAMRLICGTSERNYSYPVTLMCEELSIPPMRAIAAGRKMRAFAKAATQKTWISKLMKELPTGTGRMNTWTGSGHRFLKKYLGRDLTKEDQESSRELAKKVVSDVWDVVRYAPKNVMAVRTSKYYTDGFDKTSRYVAESNRFPDDAKGIQLLMRARMGVYSVAPRWSFATPLAPRWLRERCPFCRCGEPETMEHLLTECRAWLPERTMYLRELLDEASVAIGSLVSQGVRTEEDLKVTDVIRILKCCLLLGGESSGTRLSGWTGSKDPEGSTEIVPPFLRVARFLAVVTERRNAWLGALCRSGGNRRPLRADAPNRGRAALSNIGLSW